MAQVTYEIDQLDEHLARAMNDAPLAHFKLKPIDELTNGVHGGRVYFITGGPGAGKTSLLAQLSDELAAQGIVCVFYTLELAAHHIVAKSIARMSNGNLALADIPNPTHAPDVAVAAEAYRETIAPNTVLVDTPKTALELGSMIATIKQERAVDVALFVDYVQIMPNDASLVEERLQIKAAANDLRRIANTHDVPVIAISSVARGFYDKIPHLDKLGGSQALEYSSDVVLCLVVEGKGDEVTINAALPERPLDAATIKSRYTQMGTAKLTFDCAHATFTERR